MHKNLWLPLLGLFITGCGHSHNISVISVDETILMERAELLGQYFAESITDAVEVVDCTLSKGTQTKCYQFTLVAEADHAMGPWCPRNITDTDEAGGIWPENETIHQVSGAFIEQLSNFYGDDAWQLFDPETGIINVTDTQISCEGAAKPDVEEAYKNHCVECELAYMEAIPQITYTIPAVPVVASQPQEINNQSGMGVAFNGIKFDAPAPTANILAANTIAPFDDCGGHINLHVGYHYHEHNGCSKAFESTDHEPIIGIAFDGFLLHSESDAEDLDDCGGHETGDGYHYHIAKSGSNEFLGCYTGESGCVSENDAACDASQTQRRGPPNR